MFTAMAHRPLLWLLVALASLGAGWAAYGPLRHALQPATDTAARSPESAPLTTAESRPAAPPVSAPAAPATAPAPEVAAVSPEPAVAPQPAEPSQSPPASAPAAPAQASGQPASPSLTPAPQSPPGPPPAAAITAPSAPPAAGQTEARAPAPEPAKPEPPAAATGAPDQTRLGELAPAAGPVTPPATPLTPLQPAPEGPVAATTPEAAPLAPEAAAPPVVEPSGEPPGTAPSAGSQGRPPVVAAERRPSAASPESREPPAAALERPTAAPEIASEATPGVAPDVAKASPLPATAPAAPETSAEARAPAPARSLSLDTIRRALAALLGGSSEPADVAAQKVEKPEPKPAAVKPEGAKDLASAVEPSAGAPEVVRPSFDIVRVEPGGRAVVAGRAAPGAEVELLAGERVLDRVRANRRGEWVATPAEPLAPGGLELTLRAIKEGAPAVEAKQVVVVVVPEPPPPQPPPVAVAEGPPPQPPPVAGAEAPPPQPAEVRLAEAPAGPLAVLLTQDGRAPGRILQAPGRISSDGQLALLVLDYDDSGRTRLTGEAPPGAPLRIYVDNQPAAETVAEPSGRWTAVLTHDLAPGDYTLRLDQLGTQGRPVARLETPFTRVSQPPIQGKTQVDYVIVQPGNSLWRIARRLFGSGMRYVQVYDANKAQIRDPDLIYPGQVFEVPPGMSSAG